jgi:hypothetical protein
MGEYLIRDGGFAHALMFAFGIDLGASPARSNLKKRQAVDTILGEPTLEFLSSREVADICGVSHTFVASRRRVRDEAQV